MKILRTNATKPQKEKPRASLLWRGIAAPGDHPVLTLLAWLHVLLLFGGVYLVAAGVLLLEPPQAARLLLSGLWLLVPTVLSWLFLRKIRPLWLYLLGAAAVTGALWLITASALTTLLSALIFLLRCQVRITKGRIRREMQEMPGEAGAQMDRELWEIPTFFDQPDPKLWGLFALLYIGVLLTRQYFLLPWALYLLAADILLTFVCCYLNRMEHFILERQSIANLPAGTIRKVGRILLVMTVILLLLAILPSILYGKEPLSGFLQRFDAVDRSAPAPLAPPTPDTDDEQSLLLQQIAAEAGEPPVWLSFLFKALSYALSVLTVAVLLYAIYRICRNAAQYFAQEEEDEISFLGTEERENLNLRRRGRDHSDGRWNSPNRRIRRLYKKTLRRRLKETPGGWETPAELEELADLEGLGDAEQTRLLHELYEKARYSLEGCTGEDVKQLKG